MPLAEVLVKIHRYRAPGRVDCKRGDEVKRIYLDHGQIVFATTNQLAESLGDKLLREGRITRRQYEESVTRAQETGNRHGTTLVAMKAITPEELFTAVRGQIEEIIWPIFGWDSGTVSFTAGRDKRLDSSRSTSPSRWRSCTASGASRMRVLSWHASGSRRRSSRDRRATPRG